ncbi:MAG: class I SAM-dependent methyltransferase [Planctomycetota bacterium]|jgi:ubiquinone/menaquinone biosynthesis C-methylase UbiE|nr:class I SAM-dependent methyltransferase [Planctomycetota bacterium]
MNPGSTQKTEWFQSAFEADYLEVYPWRDLASAEVEAVAALSWLGIGPGDRILDLCCGAGRHSHWLKKSEAQLVSVDLSHSLLASARSHIGSSASLVRADIRALPFVENCFDHVMMFFTSFGYLATDAQNGAVLEQVAGVVRPGGGLLLDLPDRDSTIQQLVATSRRTEGELSIEEFRSLSATGDRVEKKVVLSRNGQQRNYTESVRLYSRDEIESMLNSSGWDLTDERGDWQGTRYQSGSTPRMILLAKRREVLR